MQPYQQWILLFAFVQVVLYLLASRQSKPTPQPVVLAPEQFGASGRLFKGQKIRAFEHRLSDADLGIIPSATLAAWKALVDWKFECSNWGVVTTIFPPTEALQRVQELDNFCVVVVLDKKTPVPFELTGPNVFIFDAKAQENLASSDSFTNALPWNHFGRKNLGYLFAIFHDAEAIFDFDDDNVLLGQLDLLSSASWVRIRNPAACLSLNPYPLMNSTEPSWPRGLPLDDLQKPDCLGSIGARLTDAELASVAVYQSLADHDPDVDSIYRLTRTLPFTFSKTEAWHGLAVPRGALAPYNAQAAVFKSSVFWGLLLPVTVPGRVSDIWRSYATQRLMWDVGLHLAFMPPRVEQQRNAHSYLADFEAEGDLYLRAGSLLRSLSNWTCPYQSMPACVQDLWIDMFERGYIEEADVLNVQAWLRLLLASGRPLPRLASQSPTQPQPQSPTNPTPTPHRSNLTPDNQTKNQPASKPSPTAPRTAVIVSGLPRTLYSPIISDWYWAMRGSHPESNEFKQLRMDPTFTTAQAIQRFLFESLENFDVFFYLSTTGPAARLPAAGNLSWCEALRPREAKNKLYCVVDEENPLPLFYDGCEEHSIWAKYSYGKDRSLCQGLLQQLHGMYRANEMRRQHSRLTGTQYAYSIRLRPDLVFTEPFPKPWSLDFGTPEQPAVLTTDEALCCCGNLDWFGIGLTEVMDPYFDRFLYTQSMGAFFLNEDVRGARGWTANSILEDYMAWRLNATVNTTARISACVYKPKDRKIVGQP